MPYLGPEETQGIFLMILGEQKGQRGAGRGLFVLFAVGTGAVEGTDDSLVSGFDQWVGAQAVITIVVGKTGILIDLQANIEVGKLMFTVLKQLGVMLDSCGRGFGKDSFLIATARNDRKVAGASVLLEIPVRFELGGGYTYRVPNA